jgi:hypothetical protein
MTPVMPNMTDGSMPTKCQNMITNMFGLNQDDMHDSHREKADALQESKWWEKLMAMCGIINMSAMQLPYLEIPAIEEVNSLDHDEVGFGSFNGDDFISSLEQEARAEYENGINGLNEL